MKVIIVRDLSNITRDVFSATDDELTKDKMESIRKCAKEAGFLDEIMQQITKMEDIV